MRTMTTTLQHKQMNHKEPLEMGNQINTPCFNTSTGWKKCNLCFVLLTAVLSQGLCPSNTAYGSMYILHQRKMNGNTESKIKWWFLQSSKFKRHFPLPATQLMYWRICAVALQWLQRKRKTGVQSKSCIPFHTSSLCTLVSNQDCWNSYSRYWNGLARLR